MTRLTAAALLTTLVVCAPTARATPGVDAFNREVQDVYQRLLPKVLAEADREARKQLLAFEHKEKKLEVRVPRVGKIDLQIGTAPGFTEVAADRLALRIPRDGCWEVEVEADVELRYRLFKKWRTKLLPVRVIVSKIRVEAALELDTSDPYLPTLKRVEEPKTKFRVKLRSKKLLPGLLLRVLSPPATLIGRRLVKKVTADLAGKVTANLAGIPAPIPGDGKPLMTGAGAPLPVGLGEIARNVDAKIQRDHTPWGLVMPMHMDVAAPASERWVDAYRDGGPGNVGTPECRDDGGDSATWTGVYLASQAFRYAVEGSSEAQANVERTVDALEFLFAAYDDRGLIPRCAAPEGSSLGQKIVAANAAGFVRKLRGGQPWVAHTGGGGVSRDVYALVMFGLMTTYDLVPSCRARCGRLIQLAVDYLIRTGWFIDEDRKPFDPVSAEGFPTFWLGVPTMKVTFLLMANRVRPGKYAAELQRWGPVIDMAWVSSWTGQFDLNGYYGKNLYHKTAYSGLRLETNPARWQAMARGFRVIRRFVHNHGQAPWDLINVSVEPSSALTFFPVVAEALRRFCLRPHRNVAPAGLDLSGLTLIDYVFPLADPLGQLNHPTHVRLADAPVPVELRDFSGNYVWQRNPFRPYPGPNTGDPHFEPPGLDLILPYWLGRYMGVSFR